MGQAAARRAARSWWQPRCLGCPVGIRTPPGPALSSTLARGRGRFLPGEQGQVFCTPCLQQLGKRQRWSRAGRTGFPPGAGTDVRARSPNSSCPVPAHLTWRRAAHRRMAVPQL